VPRAIPRTGGLVLAEVEEVPARDDVAVPKRELVERRPQSAVTAAGKRLVLCRRRRDRGAAALAGLAKCTRPSVGRAALVAGHVGDDREQPGPERGARPEAMQEAVRAHECFLGGVVRDVDAGDRGRRTSSVVLVAAYQLAIRVHVSPLRLLDQLGVVRGAPSHSGGVTGSTPAQRSGFPGLCSPGCNRA
jgi:hypothetical protein